MPPRWGTSADPGVSSPCARAREDGSAPRHARWPGASSRPAPRWNTWPSTAPRPIMSRSPGPSRSSLDWRSTWIVAGATDLPLVPVLAHRCEHLFDGGRGFPSAAVRIRPRTSVGELWVSGEPRDQQLAVLVRQRLEEDRRCVEGAHRPRPGRSSRNPASRCRGGGSERRETSRRCARSGRGRPALPTGCRRGRGMWSCHRPILDQPAKRELRIGRRGADHRRGLDADRKQDLDERPVGDVLPVVEAATAEDVAHSGDPRNSSVSRDLPTPAGRAA